MEEMVIKEDYGYLGNLITFLNGSDSFDYRLQKAEKVFFLPLNVPPQHKEEVIILWLVDLVSSSTSQIGKYMQEEVELAWKILLKLFSSKRVSALCSQHWVFQLPRTFTKTLLSIARDTTAPSAIKKEVFLICECLINRPRMSPAITYLLRNPHLLCTSLILWIKEGNAHPSLFSLLEVLVQKSIYLVKSMTVDNGLILAYDHLLLPILELLIILQDHQGPEAKSLLKEIKLFMMDYLFLKDHAVAYIQILELPIKKRLKEEFSRPSQSFFDFIKRCITLDNKEIASYILSEFTDCFLQIYKGTERVIGYYYIVSVMYMLGVSVKGGPHVEVKSMAAQSLLVMQLEKPLRERLVFSVLKGISRSEIYLDQRLYKVTLKKWLSKVGNHLLKGEIALPEYTFGGLMFIIELNPEFETSLDKLLYNLLSHPKSADENSSFVDNTLCHLLDINVKLRTLNQFMRKLCDCILSLRMERLLASSGILEAWFIRNKHHILPINFMQRLLFCIKQMGTQMSTNLCKQLTKLLSNYCSSAFTEEAAVDEISVSAAATVIWVLSCCLRVVPLMDSVAVSGMPYKVAGIMKILAEDCIKPLFRTVTNIRHGQSVMCCSLLNLTVVWAEHHSQLFSTGTGYKKQMVHHCGTDLSSADFTDFSMQIPCLNSVDWNHIFTKVLSDDDDLIRFFVIELVVQKTTLIVAQMEEHAMQGTIIDAMLLSRLKECLDFIFREEEVTRFPISSDLVALHLPFLIGHLKPVHLKAAARLFVSGVGERRVPWVKFGQSGFFQESPSLQSECFALICYKMLNLLSGRKRKLDEDNLESINSKAKSKYESRKILSSLIQLQNEDKLTEITKNLKVCFFHLFKLLSSEKNNSRLARRSEDEVIAILRVVEFMPLRELEPIFIKSVFALVMTLLIEEGELNGRRLVVSASLNILHRVLYSARISSLWKRLKPNPSCVLIWFFNKSQTVLDYYALEDSHISLILKNKDCAHSPSASSSILEQVIFFMNSYTRMFVAYYSGRSICNYARIIIETWQGSKCTDACTLAALILTVHVREVFNIKKTRGIDKVMECSNLLGHQCLSESLNVNLSTVTTGRLAIILAVFTTCLAARQKLLERIGKKKIYEAKKENEERKNSRKKKIYEAKKENEERKNTRKKKIYEAKKENENEKEEEMDVEENEVLEKEAENDALSESLIKESDIVELDLQKVVENGIRLADIALDTENEVLKDVCFDFYINAALFAFDVSSSDRWATLNKAWRLVPLNQDLATKAFKPLFESLTLERYEMMLVNLLEETLKRVHVNNLSQWATFIAIEPRPELLPAKTDSVEQLILILCMHANQTMFAKADISVLTKLLEVFFVILHKEVDVSINSKALILAACSEFALYQSSSTTNFAQVFQGTAKLMSHLLKKRLLAEGRSASFMSVITNLALSVMEHAHQNEGISDSSIKELERCCDLLERMTKDLKQYSTHFFKIIPFSIGNIVEKMQQTKLFPSVKASITRTVYTMLDLSDPYSLRHLLVSLPPSVISLLKHLQATFSDSLRFNPRHF